MSELLHSLGQHPLLAGGAAMAILSFLAAWARRLPSEAWRLARGRYILTVEIADRDPAFYMIIKWMAKERATQRTRNISVTTAWPNRGAPPVSDCDPDHKPSFLFSPAPGLHWFRFRGRLFIVHRRRRDLDNASGVTMQESFLLQVLAGTHDLVRDFLAAAFEASLEHEAVIKIQVSDGEKWRDVVGQPVRPLASVILKDDLLAEILSDAREFAGSRPWYEERGIPYRRGYLFHGPPGNGKTTAIKAMAGELGLSVACLSMGNPYLTDDGLNTLITSLSPRSILLIEDVDCVFRAKRETEHVNHVTVSGLLNALDGLYSGEGRILILTTNHPERLDPALIRPGRIDRSIQIGNATTDQARRLFLWFYHDQVSPAIEALAVRFANRDWTEVSMAAVQEHLLRYRGEPYLAACADLALERAA